MKALFVFVALILTGCASTHPVYTTKPIENTVVEIVRTVPQAAGTYTSAVIFGGQVSANPHPIYYLHDSVNRQGRQVYGYSRRFVQTEVSSEIEKVLFFRAP
jgi:hypothetical protein